MPLPPARPLRNRLAAATAMLLLPAAALASSCDVSAHPLDCRLSAVLNALTIVAVLLALLLVLVLLLAIRSFRRHRPDSTGRHDRSSRSRADRSSGDLS